MEYPKKIVVIERTEAEFLSENDTFVTYSHQEEGSSKRWGFNKLFFPKMIKEKSIEVVE